MIRLSAPKVNLVPKIFVKKASLSLVFHPLVKFCKKNTKKWHEPLAKRGSCFYNAQRLR